MGLCPCKGNVRITFNVSWTVATDTCPTNAYPYNPYMGSADLEIYAGHSLYHDPSVTSSGGVSNLTVSTKLGEPDYVGNNFMIFVALNTYGKCTANLTLTITETVIP
jgi:hypothetical protein